MKESDLLFTPLTVARKLALRNWIVLTALWPVWDRRGDEYRAFYVVEGR
jgi:hypothetical protein